MASRRVTLADVALVADVSRSTVSKVLNGMGRVSPETRDRIWDVARRLDFQPNALARSFATGQSLTVGLLTKNALSTFAMPVLIGASGAFGAADLASLMYDVEDGSLNDLTRIRKLQSRQIDGLLVVGDGLGAALSSVGGYFDVPVVYAFGFSTRAEDTSFLPDSRMAGRMAGQHLLDIGRRRIGHITSASDRAAADRAEGLREVLDEAGLGLVLDHPLRGDWSRAWGAEGARRILDSGESVDAIFCGDDWIALGAQSALRAAGVRIPDDVAILGVDNLSGLLGRPGGYLSTIDPCLSTLGGAAAEHLLQRMGGADPEPGVHYQDCVLIAAGSTVGTLSEGVDQEGEEPLWQL